MKCFVHAFTKAPRDSFAGFVWLILLLGLLSTVDHSTAAAKDAPPNIVVVLTDDQGWGDLSVHGNTNLSTPHADSLARDGVLFERFYVQPVCSPTRAEFLTGRWHPRGGVYSTSTGGERLDLDERTIANVFSDAGYATGAFGKWHNGTQYPYHPTGRGFAEFYGFCSGHWGDYFSPPLEHNGRPVQGQGFISDDFTDHALQFIEAHRAGPFFCYLALNTPHSPMQVPDRFWDKFKDADLPLRYGGPQEEDLAQTRAALAMCESNDWNLGRVLARLEELKLAENTIVLFFCDNGPNGWRWTGGMKGHKASTDEGGVRSPLLIRWPGHISPGTRLESIAAAVDLLPTLAGLAGIPVAPTKPLDGINLAGQLLGNRATAPPRLIYSHWNDKVSVRDQQYLLDHRGQLFDITADLGQTKNIAAAQPAEAARLSKAVEDWRSTVLAEMPREPRPYPVGHRQSPLTVLPARDAEPHGAIERSSRAPNCSFLKNWRSTADRITWDIEVATTGRYEAIVHYTCPAADIGSTVALDFGSTRVTAKVTEAFDPPLRGAEHDRVPRSHESLVKDFKPLRLGTIELPAGRGILTLSAVDIPGRTVMDVRGITLTKVDD